MLINTFVIPDSHGKYQCNVIIWGNEVEVKLNCFIRSIVMIARAQDKRIASGLIVRIADADLFQPFSLLLTNKWLNEECAQHNKHGEILFFIGDVRKSGIKIR